MKNIINENTVLKFYLDQMNNDKITFLQGKEDAKSEIRNLIIKLDELPDIHLKIQVAKQLWKVLFEHSMTAINPDKRGYDKLFKYFDEYVNFEELIFASDSFYRDHTLHCLWVYFLGEYLYCKQEFKSIFKYIFEDNILVYEMEELSNDKRLNGVFKKVLDYTKPFNDVMKNSDALRCLSALTHDLGYPLKKIQKINKSIGNILPYFAISNFNDFSFSYTNEQGVSIEMFIELLASQLHVDVAGENEEILNLLDRITEKDLSLKQGFNREALSACSEDEIKILRNIEPKVSFNRSLNDIGRYGEDFENYEHGIMSAFILYKTLMSNKSYRLLARKDGKVQARDMDIKMYDSLNIIYTSISDHTSPSYKINSINNPSAFLILIDELEEFSRISRANQNRQYISEFCKSAIYMENEIFCVDFIFDNKDIVNLDPERAFKGRCIKKLNLFDISNLDEDFKLRLRCIDSLQEDDKVYELSISHKFAKITIDDVEMNIPQYLKTRELYTREEYEKL